MTEKTRKARKMDIQEALYIQSRGIAADYIKGRCVAPYHSGSSSFDVEQRERFSYAHLLTPTEQWAVQRGYMKNPFAERPNRKVERDAFKSAVYLADGRRRVFLTADAAYEYFERRDDAVKIWDGVEGRYTLMR